MFSHIILVFTSQLLWAKFGLFINNGELCSGYMAPEYLVRGQLTEKADVYAFGVLVLEILSGRKSSVFAQGSGSVLPSVRLLVLAFAKNLDRHLLFLATPHQDYLIFYLDLANNL